MAWPRSKKVKPRAKATKPKPLVPLEADEQAAFISYLHRLPEPWCDTYFAVPNDGRRGFIAQRLFKKLGGRRGVPDLFVMTPSGKYHALALEFKRAKGSVTTPEQLEWQERLRRQGYKAEIVRGCDAAIAVLENYRNGI